MYVSRYEVFRVLIRLFADAIIVIGGSYNVTVDRRIMTANMEICPDIVSRNHQAHATIADPTFV